MTAFDVAVVLEVSDELGHRLLGDLRASRELADFLVDCVTYIVCASVRLDVGGESIPSIAG